MKKRLLLLVFLLGFGICSVLAQAPPPPPANAGSGGGPIGGGAPIDGGIALYLLLLTGYAGRNLYQKRKSQAESPGSI